MAKLIALSTIMHNGLIVTEGAEFEVKSTAEAEALVESGAVLEKGGKANLAITKPAADSVAGVVTQE